MSDPIPLLLIDDDAELAAMIREYLAPRGFAVTGVGHGGAGLEAALGGRFALVILDVMLPGLDGVSVLRQVRKRSAVPVILLTARVTEADRIGGLNAGADDYLTKPFGPGELLARVRAVLRRAGHPVSAGRETIAVGGLSLIPADRAVVRDGRPLPLTDTEYDILEHLARSAGRVVTRRELMAVLYQVEYAPYDRALDVHVSHLRRKLGDAAATIRTVRGEGYTLLPQAAAVP